MYTHHHDSERALFVGRMSAGGDELGDFDTHFEHVWAACLDANEQGLTLRAVFILDRDHALPDARIRQKAAELTSRPEFKPEIAMVAANPMFRGVLTALSWLRKKRYEDIMVDNVPKAIAWHEHRHGAALLELRAMLDKIQGS